MADLNEHLSSLPDSYLFRSIETKVQALQKEHPHTSFLNLGIGDIQEPISPHLVSALCSASQEMGHPTAFKGYGPSQGYSFLREAIFYAEYRHLGISADEIFISNGAKSDLAHFQELFSSTCKIGMPDPAYPVFWESHLMAGKASGSQLVKLLCLEANNFLPTPPFEHCDLIYLCSPNNPTGTAMTRKDLHRWVEYALKHQAILFYDGAYASYITSPDCPKSIYEIDRAKEVAIEIRSFSKSAGFTGLRCSYSVVPKELTASLQGKPASLHTYWKRRQDTKFGGVPYPIQQCAAAIYSPRGQKEVTARIETYRQRALFLLEGLNKLGFTLFGGVDSPYIWCKTPHTLSSWEFFEQLLHQAHIICIPGKGLGNGGEGFVRFSAFTNPKDLAEALLRMKKCTFIKKESLTKT